MGKLRNRSKSIGSCLLSFSLLVLSFTNAGTAFAAETGSYPWYDAVELNINNYDWGYSNCLEPMKNARVCSAHYGYKSGATYHMSDPWRYDVRNCTSFVAWKIFSTTNISIAGWGNANNWQNGALSAGYRVDQSAQIGDIAVWNGGKYGHVAYVTSVNLDGSVNVEQYNKAGKGEFSRQSRVKADNYIHVSGTIPLVEPQKILTSTTPTLIQRTASELTAVETIQTKPIALAVPTSNPDSIDSTMPAGVDDTVSYFVGSNSSKEEIKTFAVQHAKTKSGKVEIKISNSKSGQDTDQQSKTSWEPEQVTSEPIKTLGQAYYSLEDYDANGSLDMYVIGENEGKIEVSVLDGSNSYLSYIGKWKTNEKIHEEHTVWYGIADSNGDGSLDIYQVWHDNTKNNLVEVKILNGKTNFATILSDSMIPEKQHSASDVYYLIGDNNGDGKQDLYQVLHNQTKSKNSEVLVFDGDNNFIDILGNWVTELPNFVGFGPNLD